MLSEQEYKRAEAASKLMRCEHLHGSVSDQSPEREHKSDEVSHGEEQDALSRWSTQTALLLKLFASQFTVRRLF